jgi:chemotaxis protein methyltransferase CheR
MVTFHERNLVDKDPSFWRSSTYDVVFCRNVLMYFAPEVMRQVVGRVGSSLLPDGFLFLGHAETLRGMSQEFHLRHTHDTFYYQRRGKSGASIEWDDASPPALDEVATSHPSVVEPMVPWFDVIQRASARIASLPTTSMETRPGVESDASASEGSTTHAPDFALVLDAMRQERFADALNVLSDLPADALEEPDALLLRAALLTNCGRLDEAEETCHRLIVLDELNAGAHYLTALCREHAGDVSGAMEHNQSAIYLDAGFAMPHLHLGLIAKRGGDAVAARRGLAQALALLAHEDSSRLLLFGGGFSREALMQVCRAGLAALGGP